MQTILLKPAVVAAGLALMLATGAPAFAETLGFVAHLSGTSETPPNDSQATGQVTVLYDTETKVMDWLIEYSGLTGDAKAAHFHGPAAEGEKAPPVVPISGSLASPIRNQMTLTDAQAADMQAGKWYFNIHTAKFPDGEIRGQLLPP